MDHQSTLWEQPVPTPPRAKAAQWITDGLTACLPPGVPLFFTRIISAAFTGKQKAVATLEVFDGGLYTVEVSKWAPHGDAWAIKGIDLPGGAFHWNGTVWERIDLDLFGEGAA